MDISRALFLARITSYWRFYLFFGFFLPLRLSFIVLFGGYFLSLVLLLLGLVSAKSHLHVQLIRAELSSKSSSEHLSESLSKLSSHQIPRCLESEGPLQLKGCTRSSSSHHQRLRGLQCSVRSFRTQHSTSTSGSNRRDPPPRGSSSPAHLGPPLLPPLAVWPFYFTRRSLMPRCAACGSTVPVDPLSLLLDLRLLS